MSEESSLRALLAIPERPPDREFVETLRLTLVAEERLRAARRAEWRRAGSQAAAGAASIASFLVIAGRAPAIAWNGIVPLSSSLVAGLLLLTLGLIAATGPRSGLPKPDPYR